MERLCCVLQRFCLDDEAESAAEKRGEQPRGSGGETNTTETRAGGSGPDQNSFPASPNRTTTNDPPQTMPPPINEQFSKVGFQDSDNLRFRT